MSKVMRIQLKNGAYALVDEEDYVLVSGFRWHHVPTATNGGGFYAATVAKKAGGQRTTLYMHRLITGAPKGKEVDHLNHETLDNRRENLRVGSHKDNMLNGRFALATHCPKGHLYDAKNTYFDARGRRCRMCATERMRTVMAKETPEQRAHRSEVKKAYYARTKEKHRERGQIWAAAHREELREYRRQWRENRKS